jgi:hypothetical protein
MYREVTMIEIREVLRLRGEGLPKKRIAAQLGLDPKTVRRYLRAAATAGVRVAATVSDEEVRQVLLALHPAGGRPWGDGWARCLEHRSSIERWLGDRVRLTKIRKLLVRHGVEILSHAPSLRSPRVAVWQDRHDDPRARWRAGARAAGRYRLGRLAHAATAQEETVSRVDLHGGALAAPLRLSDVRGDHRSRD